MKIGLVAPVKPSHPYLENDPAPLFDLHYLCISPWLWFRGRRLFLLIEAFLRFIQAITHGVGLDILNVR